MTDGVMALPCNSDRILYSIRREAGVQDEQPFCYVESVAELVKWFGAVVFIDMLVGDQTAIGMFTDFTDEAQSEA
ncbi:MAG: hypothetical protein KJ630_19015 [Proteobacteria bacterium]|nr:hypothetical protein [Pseudomonadota bacterium]